MVSKFSRAGPSRQAPEITRTELDDIISVGGEGILKNEQANNRRLRQAINYIATEGSPDPPLQYADRVEKIDQYIIRKYADEGYPFDYNLYQQLRTVVREAQCDFQRAGKWSPSLAEGSESMEDIRPTEALYRTDDENYEAGEPIFVRESGNFLGGPLSTPVQTSPRPADVRVQFLYGGPNNEVEEWYKDFPASLPFGETRYMQEWESMMTDYDVRENAMKQHGDNIPIVETQIPYESVKLSKGHPYDSGSRFKLPSISKEDENKLFPASSESKLSSVVDVFNQADPKHQVAKNYVPRIFLERVVPNRQHRGSASNPPRMGTYAATAAKRLSQSYTARPSSTNPSTPTRIRSADRTVAGPSTPRRFPASKYGYINQDVFPQIQKHPQRGPITVLSEDNDYLEPEPTRRKGKGKAEAISRLSTSRPAVTSKAPHRSTVAPHADPFSEAGPVKRMGHVATSPRIARQKRKLTDAGVSYDIVASKSKRPAVKDIAEKRVTFAADADDDTIAVAQPKRKAIPKRKAMEVAKARKERDEVQARLTAVTATPLRAAADYEKVKRGITRSGAKFKG